MHTQLRSIHFFSLGIPEIQMQPVEPLDVSNINIQDGIGRPVKMSLDLNNAKLHGLTQSRLKSVRLCIFRFFISSVSLLGTATWLKHDFSFLQIFEVF
jgi:hypothetical protein